MIQKKSALVGKKILVIGGDLDFLNNIERMFLYAGIESFIYSCATEGVFSIKSQRPDLVLIETTICEKSTDMTTVDLLKNLQIENSGKVPVMLVTSSDEKEFSNFDIEKIVNKDTLNIVDLLDKIGDVLRTSTDTETMLDISEETELPQNSIKEIKVFVIEDDPLLRNLLSVRLSKSKIQYQFCHNGNDALAMLQQYKPTIVILDIMLPGKNGLVVLKELRQIEKWAKLPVIVFSNKDSDEDKKIAHDLNADAFLVKAMTNLNDLITLILKKHR